MMPHFPTIETALEADDLINHLDIRGSERIPGIVGSSSGLGRRSRSSLRIFSARSSDVTNITLSIRTAFRPAIYARSRTLVSRLALSSVRLTGLCESLATLGSSTRLKA